MSNEVTVHEAGSIGALYEMIQPEIAKQGIYSLLPSHITPESFTRAAAIAMVKNPDLVQADMNSVIMALSDSAKDGLVPDGREAALVIFNTKQKVNGRDTWVKKAQYLPMVDGVLKRARQSGQVDVIAGKAVYEGDEFDYWLDEHGEHIKYRPNFTNRGVLTLVFAFAKLKSGELIVEVMTKEEIDKVRAASKGSQYGAWADWYDRMGIKSVLHRLARRLPNASELLDMLEAGQEMTFKDVNQASVSQAPESRANLQDLKSAMAGKESKPEIEHQEITTEPELEQAKWSDAQEDEFNAALALMDASESMKQLKDAASSDILFTDMPAGYRDVATKRYRSKSSELKAGEQNHE